MERSRASDGQACPSRFAETRETDSSTHTTRLPACWLRIRIRTALLRERPFNMRLGAQAVTVPASDPSALEGRRWRSVSWPTRPWPSGPSTASPIVVFGTPNARWTFRCGCSSAMTPLRVRSSPGLPARNGWTLRFGSLRLLPRTFRNAPSLPGFLDVRSRGVTPAPASTRLLRALSGCRFMVSKRPSDGDMPRAI